MWYDSPCLSVVAAVLYLRMRKTDSVEVDVSTTVGFRLHT